MFEYIIYNEIERDNGAFLTLIKYERESPMIGANHIKLKNVKILNRCPLQISNLEETYILKSSILKRFKAEDDDAARLIFELGEYNG